MRKLDRLCHVQKLMEEYGNDFEVFICDFMKDLINSLPEGLDKDDEMMVLSEIILQLFTKRIAYTLAPFNAEYVATIWESMKETVLSDHKVFSHEFKQLVKNLSNERQKPEEE